MVDSEHRRLPDNYHVCPHDKYWQSAEVRMMSYLTQDERNCSERQASSRHLLSSPGLRILQGTACCCLVFAVAKSFGAQTWPMHHYTCTGTTHCTGNKRV